MASLASDGISHEEMNSLKLYSPQSRYNPFYAFARSRALRLAVKCLQFGLTVVAMAGLLAPMNLAAHRRKSASAGAIRTGKVVSPAGRQQSARCGSLRGNGNSTGAARRLRAGY